MKIVILLILISSLACRYYPHHPYPYPKPCFRARKSVRNNWATDEKVRGGAMANSRGNGASTAYTGKSGSQAKAYGSEGSGSWTKHQKEANKVSDNFSVYRDNKGRRKVIRKRFAEKELNDNHADAISKGRGYTAAISDDDRSAAKGRGSRGTKVDSAYNNQTDKVGDNFSMYHDGHKTRKVRDTFATNDRIRTAGRGMGIGNGKAITNSNGDGSAVKARGDCFSQGQTRHKADSKAKRDRWSRLRIGNRVYNKRRNWAKRNASNGRTNSKALGKGFTKSFTNKNNGSGAHSKGTRGTNNKAKYNSDENNTSDAWSDKGFWGHKQPVYKKPYYRRRRKPYCGYVGETAE